MSHHRVIAPPPLALAVHPAPPPKTREEVRKEDEKRRAERHAKAEAEEAKLKAAKGDKKGEDGKDEGQKEGEPDTPGPHPDTPAVKDTPDVPAPKGPSEDKADPAKDDADPSGPKEEPKSEKPLSPLRLLPPVPRRPVRSRLDLDPSRPYPPINSDPRGAYNSYAKAMQDEVMYIDVTKDGWLTEQWKERNEREALARLTGEAEKQHMREVAMATMESVKRLIPSTAEGLILELWNDLVEAESNELSVEAFWARYDWTDPKAEKHLQIMPFEEKEKAKAAEILRVEKEVKAEELATLARRAARERDRLAEEEKEKRKKKGKEVASQDAKEVKGEQAEVEETKPADKVEKDGDGDAAAGKEEVKTVDSASVTVGKTGEAMKEEEPAKPTYQFPVEVEWTREGVEEILEAVGIQCAYNSEKRLPAHWSSPSGAYLLLAHNHFLLRIESDILFKPDGPPEKFEAVVTSVDDRVFGEMVKKQKAAEQKKKDREYRDRKEREYKEKKEKERKARKEKEREGGEGVKSKADDEAKKQVEAEEEEKRNKSDGLGEPGAPAKPAINPATAVPPNRIDHVDVGAAPAGKSGELGAQLEIVAVPVKDSQEAEKGMDEKHEALPVLVGPKLAIVPAGSEAKGEKVRVAEKEKGEKGEGKAEVAKEFAAKPRPKDPNGPGAEAELLLKMLGPDAADIPLEDLKAAFQAMEHAAAEQKAQAKAVGDKRDGPMIWAWNEPCERWRWQNLAAGCAVIEDGGWEERDWKEFADDRGAAEFEAEMEWEEVLGKDNYDWTC